MDCEKLICAVQEHIPLWDMRDMRYHRRDVQRILWTEIAEEMNASVEDVKKKWQGLRDTFRKEFNKVDEQKSGESGIDPSDSSWPYFNQMLFLKSVVVQRKLNVSSKKRSLQQSQINITQELSSLEQTSSDLLENVKIEAPSSPSDDSQNLSSESRSSINYCGTSQLPNVHPSSFSRNKRKKQNIPEDPLLAESAVLKQTPDYHFLMSLLPYLMKVPEDRKLIVRNRLQQVLIDDQERAFRIPHYSP